MVLVVDMLNRLLKVVILPNTLIHTFSLIFPESITNTTSSIVIL